MFAQSLADLRLDFGRAKGMQCLRWTSQPAIVTVRNNGDNVLGSSYIPIIPPLQRL